MAGSKSRRNPFPLAEGKMRGYVPSEVDAYLELVKRTYESDPSLRTPVTASDIRTKGFKLTKRGYDPRYVDAALDRLEEVLFDRERRDFQTREGVAAWEKHVAQLRRELFGRMRRERTTRFKRTSIFSSGYRIQDKNIFSITRLHSFLLIENPEDRLKVILAFPGTAIEFKL